jgi:TonB family protein
MDAGAPAATSSVESSVFGRERPADGGAPGDASAPPAAGAVNARGSIDKEIVRRIIRSHIKEAKDCYEPELEKRPGLAGRIQVQFTIAASGVVIASVLQSSTMDDARVESCIVQAVRGWQFPKPLHGIVIISYPFVLTPAKPAP